MADVAAGLHDSCRLVGILDGVRGSVMRGVPLPVCHTRKSCLYAAELLDLRVSLNSNS